MGNFKLFSLFLRMRSSFWFIPFIMIALSMALASSVISIDKNQFIPDTIFFQWLKNMGPGGARAILSTIAGSTITVAGVIFSIAMVVLTMASSQFGPRLIPTFMRVGRIQFGIGLFVGSFVYCLLVLTFIPAENKSELLPVWSVVVGMLIGISAFLVLIMLIHEIATFIQAPNVAERVAKDIRDTFSRIFPKESTEEVDDGVIENWKSRLTATSVHSICSGYIRAISYESATEKLCQKDWYLHLTIKPGQYVIENQKIGTLYSDASVEAEVARELCESIHVGPDRDLTQDAEYAIDQMVEIALRALSPGINDPFTALNCIDKLSDALSYLSTRHISYPLWKDETGTNRLIGKPDTYSSILTSAFAQIRQHASGNPAVSIRLVEAYTRLLELDLNSEYRKALIDKLDNISQLNREAFEFKHDQDDFENALEIAKKLS